MKITQKQLNGYKKAKKNWLSANEEYNKSVYGITTELYHKIKSAENSLNGICGVQTINLKNINKQL